MQLNNQKEIIFVFRISNSPLSRLIANCPLYKVTNGPLGRSKQWRVQEKKLPFLVSYIYKNNIPKELSGERSNLPLVAFKDGSETRIILEKDQIIDCDGNELCILGKIQQNLRLQD